MAAIVIGETAEGRIGYLNPDYTAVNKGAVADGDGIITSVEIWVETTMPACTVGTFYTINGDTLRCRDSAAIGEVVSGAKRTFTEDSEAAPLAIQVRTGDFIGFYALEGRIERDDEGFDGVWYATGEHIDADDEAEYSTLGEDAISLYGTGTTVEAEGGMPGLSIGAMAEMAGVA